MRLAEVGRGSTPRFHSPAPEPRPPNFSLYHKCPHHHPWNFLASQGPILHFSTSAYLRNKSLLRDEMLIKYFCFHRSLLQTHYPDPDERKMVRNFRHCNGFLRADQTAPQSTLPTQFFVYTTDTGAHWPSNS